MAIAYDNSFNASYGGSSGTSKTFSYTVGSGSDRMLFVNVHTDSNVVTGVTYNGVAMTKVLGFATDFYNTIWALVAPATGANNVVITCSSSVNIIPMAISYSGCDQNTPTITNSGTTASSTITVNVTTTADNSWLMGFQRKNAGGAVTAGANTTIRQDDTTYGFTTCDSNGPQTPTGSYGQSLTYSATKWLGVVAFAPVASGGGFTPTPMLHMLQMAGGIV